MLQLMSEGIFIDVEVHINYASCLFPPVINISVFCLVRRIKIMEYTKLIAYMFFFFFLIFTWLTG